jgi:hypothetical protein
VVFGHAPHGTAWIGALRSSARGVAPPKDEDNDRRGGRQRAVDPPWPRR